MTSEVIPLRPGQSATSALTYLDVTAAELLRQGRAATLSGARLDAILIDLLDKRAVLTKVLADLQSRPSSGDARIDAVNATLIAEASKGLAHIDIFILSTEACAASVTAKSRYCAPLLKAPCVHQSSPHRGV